MEYPETLTADILLEHAGHEIIVERYGRGGVTVAAGLECQTCPSTLALEWTEAKK
jgi:hypothetical protein